MVEADLLAQFTTIVTPTILIGGMLFGAVRWLSGQAEKKADRVRDTAEKTAADLKSTAERTAAELKKVTEDIALEAKKYSDEKYILMTEKISEVDNKVMEMLSDLRKRADLTNGNVSSIRTDIADLQEDIQMIFDEKAEAVGDGDEMIIKTRKREQDKRRRNKRRAIERDRIDQSERQMRDHK